MRGSRWGFGLLLAGVLLVAAFPAEVIRFGAAQTAPLVTGTTLIGTSGTPGTFGIGYGVGVCRQSESGGVWQAEVDVPGPTATALPGVSGQRIEWEPRLYQTYPDTNIPQIVQRGSVQSSDVAPGASTTFTKQIFTGLPVGPRYVAGGILTWRTDSTVHGTYEFVYIEHHSRINGSQPGIQNGGCAPAMPAQIGLSTYRTTVNVTVRITGRFFPISAPVQIKWNGATLATVTSDSQGMVSGSIRVPATPLGDYQIALVAGSWWVTSATLTVVPRVKVIPDTAARGETVKISLRGYAKREVVRIRWKQGDRWVEIGRVTTSSTGSGQLYIPVPGWVPDGKSSVRGDGSVGRAQTNAVWISGGDLLTLASEPSPTPSTTATPTSDGSPMPDLTATAEPTQTVTAEPTQTVTAEPTETAITPAPTETPQPTMTAIATEAPTETATVAPPETPPSDAAPTETAAEDGP